MKLVQRTSLALLFTLTFLFIGHLISWNLMNAYIGGVILSTLIIN